MALASCLGEVPSTIHHKVKFIYEDRPLIIEADAALVVAIMKAKTKLDEGACIAVIWKEKFIPICHDYLHLANDKLMK